MEQGSQWEKAYSHGVDVYRNEKIRMDFSININPLGMPDFIMDFTACRRRPLCLETGLRS